MLASRQFTVLAALASLGAFGLSGCVYVSQSDLEQKFDSLDQDQDGVLDAEDCAFADAGRFPGNAEVVFDGVDQDCDGYDLVDADGDGFPAQGHAAWPQISETQDEFWPPSVTQENIDCDDLTDDDADGVPGATYVYPGAADVRYDGVDANCAGDDDYDADGDGHVRPQDAEKSPLPADDCLDTRADVFPGTAVPDLWYDGLDQDCDGSNDFDKDGDGYMPNPPRGTTMADWKQQFENFCGLHRYTTGDCASNAAKYGDCVDDEDSAPLQLDGFPVDPAVVHPDADDAFYDGIDADCGRDNDFDQDRDGFIRNVDLSKLDTYLINWNLTRSGVRFLDDGDCDDANAAFNPGELEVLGDAADQNCDGRNDGSPWHSGGYTWSDPRTVAVTANDHHLVLATAADASSATPTASQPGVALLIERPDCEVAGYCAASGAPSVKAFHINGFESGRSIDVLGDGDRFFVGWSYIYSNSSSAPRIYSLVKQYAYDVEDEEYTETQKYQASSSMAVAEPFQDADLGFDGDGNVWMLGCGPDGFSYVVANPASGLAKVASGWYAAMEAESFGGTCTIEPPVGVGDGEAVFCDGSGCDSYDISLTGGSSYAGSQPSVQRLQSNHSGEWRVDVAADGSVAIIGSEQSYPLFTSATYRSRYAEAATDADGTVYLAAVVADKTGDGRDDLLLAYGDPSAPGSMTKVETPFVVDGNTYVPQSVSIHADATGDASDRVFVGATGQSANGACTTNCGTVAWTVFQR
jgi:hypothetical protein